VPLRDEDPAGKGEDKQKHFSLGSKETMASPMVGRDEVGKRQAQDVRDDERARDQLATSRGRLPLQQGARVIIGRLNQVVRNSSGSA
jgi:hypothetical protein